MAALHGVFVRRLAYPLWQIRRGGHVLDELRFLQQSQWWTPRQLQLLQQIRLRRLMRVAVRAPYYREALRRAGMTARDVRSPADLATLPTLAKADLRDHPAELMTAAPAGSLVKRTTSGSTGIPLTVWTTQEARDAWAAALLRAAGWWRIGVGERRLNLISRHTLTYALWVKQFAFANIVECSALDLSDAAMERIFWWLSRGRVQILSGYPSSLCYLAEVSARRGLAVTLSAVMTTGEVLHADQRKLLESVFHCPVVNSYGSSEIDNIAMQCPQGRLHIAAENVIVEVAAHDGTSDGDLLVTDLRNSFMPLIRYQIGDQGGLEASCPCGRGLPVLRLVDARVSDLVMLPDGRRSDFSVFAQRFEDLAARGIPVHQYQVSQHSLDSFDVLIAGPPSLQRVATDLQRSMIEALRVPVHLTVRVVQSIPPEPSGKRRRFIPLQQGTRRAVDSVAPEVHV